MKIWENYIVEKTYMIGLLLNAVDFPFFLLHVTKCNLHMMFFRLLYSMVLSMVPFPNSTKHNAINRTIRSMVQTNKIIGPYFMAKRSILSSKSKNIGSTSCCLSSLTGVIMAPHSHQILSHQDYLGRCCG